MQNSKYVDDYIDDTFFETASAFIKITGDNFCELASTLHLDPSKDFQYANLYGTCFDNCDLSEFNFRGADLRRCYGLNVKFGEGTNLDGALTDDSLFSDMHRSVKFFRGNTKFELVTRRMKNAHWTEQILWVNDQFESKKFSKNEIIEIAKYLFNNTTDAVLKSNILYFIGKGFTNIGEHRDFLLSVLSKDIKDPRTTLSVVKVLSALFSNDDLTHQWLKQVAFFDNMNDEIRNAAMQGVLKSSKFSLEFQKYSKFIKEFSAPVRRTYLRRTAMLLGEHYVVATTDPIQETAIDMSDPISERMIRSIARKMLRTDAYNSSFNRQPVFQEPNEEKIAHKSLEILERMKDLINIGVPLELNVDSLVFEKIIQDARDRKKSSIRSY